MKITITGLKSPHNPLCQAASGYRCLCGPACPTCFTPEGEMSGPRAVKASSFKAGSPRYVIDQPTSADTYSVYDTKADNWAGTGESDAKTAQRLADRLNAHDAQRIANL